MTNPPAAAVLDLWRASSWYKAGNILLHAHHLVMVVVCLAYFIRPSVSIAQLLSPTWGLLWSILLGVFGAIGFVARLRQSYMAESVCVAVVGFALLLWGIVVVEANDSMGLQTGLALIAGAFYRGGWAAIQFAWITQPPLLDRLVAMIGHELGKGERP